MVVYTVQYTVRTVYSTVQYCTTVFGNSVLPIENFSDEGPCRQVQFYLWTCVGVNG